MCSYFEIPVDGDLDTVSNLVDYHQQFEEELARRNGQVGTLKKTAEDLIVNGRPDDADDIRSEVAELTNAWENIWNLCNNRSESLADAQERASDLQRSVNEILECLRITEMKLQFSGPLPDNVVEVQMAIEEHKKVVDELLSRESEKESALNLAEKILEKAHPKAVSVLKNMITVIHSRWGEVASWAEQRSDNLQVSISHNQFVECRIQHSRNLALIR